MMPSKKMLYKLSSNTIYIVLAVDSEHTSPKRMK